MSINDQLNAANDELNTELLRCRNTRVELNADVENLRQSCQEKEEKIKCLESKMATLEEEINNCQEQYEQNRSFEIQLDSLSRKLDAQMSINDQLNAANDELNTELLRCRNMR
eukprot:15251792-Ditylum_brightwellii.AAC.1